MKAKKDWKKAQNQSVWENDIMVNYDIVKGLRNYVERRLSIAHGCAFVKDIMDKVDLIIEYSAEMGGGLEKIGRGHCMRNNLNRAREERANG